MRLGIFLSLWCRTSPWAPRALCRSTFLHFVASSSEYCGWRWIFGSYITWVYYPSSSGSLVTLIGLTWKGGRQSSAILFSLFIFIRTSFLAVVFLISNLSRPPFWIQVGVPSLWFFSSAQLQLCLVQFNPHHFLYFACLLWLLNCTMAVRLHKYYFQYIVHAFG